MATQTVEFRAAPGLTLTARLFTPGSDTIVQTASAVTEATNRKGTYAATFTDPGAAEFELIALSGTTPVCRWLCSLTLTTATFQAYEVRTAAVVARVTANTDQWGGVAVTGMPLPTASYTTPPTVAQVVTGVYAALPTDHTVSGSYGVRLILALNSNRVLQITGSNHAAADVHEFQPDVIDATAIAASAVTEIQSGLATLANQTTIISYIDTEVAAIKVVTDKLNTGLVADGAVWQYTANMLELAPAGGGGAGDASQATLLQVQTTVNGMASSLSGVPITATGRIADGGTISLYCGDDLRVRSGTQLTLTVTDVGGSIYSRLNTIGTSNLAFGASRRGLPVSAISGSIASLTSVGSGASQTVRLVIEIDNAGGSLQPAEDYEWQIESEQTQGSEIDQLVEMAGILILRRRTV